MRGFLGWFFGGKARLRSRTEGCFRSLWGKRNGRLSVFLDSLIEVVGEI